MSSDTRCFHCGSVVAAGSPWQVRYRDVLQPCCCGGCQAAAELVLGQGLGRYYEFRSGESRTPDPQARDWTVFDREQSLRRYTRLEADGARTVSLQLEGLHCTACGWLIENSLRQMPGVLALAVQVPAERAELRFDPQRVCLSALLRRLSELGYVGRPLGFTAKDEDGRAERRRALLRLAVAGLGMMQVMTFAASLYAGALQGMDANLARLMQLVSMIVATPVVLFSAQPFFAGAWRSLRARTLGMDVPVAASIGAAYVWSVWSTLIGHGTVYFDSAVMFTFFLLCGRYIEMALRHRSGLQQHALARLLPDSVLRLKEGQSERVTPDELVAGDEVAVLPGERVAADGIVTQGESEFDESLLTGEAAPRRRGIGDALTAGTLNVSHPLQMRVLRVGPDSTLAAVSRLLVQAQMSRPHFADLADRVAAWFVAAVLLLAAGVAIHWLRVDPARAFPTVLAVLVVTCPCALSLATPAALAAATSRLARAGLLVTRGRALERLARADRVVFDKTGTLTVGQVRIRQVHVADGRCDVDRCLAIGAALERFSTHPIAAAFAHHAPAAGAVELEAEPGRGVGATIDGVRYRLGRQDFVTELCAERAGMPAPVGSQQGGVLLADSRGVLAWFELTDALREDAGDTVAQLRQRGIEPLMASGDRAEVVAAIAQRLGAIPARSALDAAGKLACVRELQQSSHGVIMVGDGINDAPVLSGADVSIAVGSGTDLAKVSADLVLMGDRLMPIVEAVDTARRTRRIIRQNLLWAVVYNATAVPLAAAGLLQPWMASIGMSLSSLLVVLNATRLLRQPLAVEARRSQQPRSLPEALAV